MVQNSRDAETFLPATQTARLPRRLLRDDWKPRRLSDAACSLYNDLLSEGIMETRVMPGFGVIHEMLVERAAFFFAAMKEADISSDEPDWGVYGQQTKAFLKVIEELFREGRQANVEDSFKRSYAFMLARVITDNIPDGRISVDGRELKQKIIAAIKEGLVTELTSDAKVS